MRLYALYISFAASFSGCIYGDMDTSTSSSSAACEALTEAVCRDCDEEYCEYYSQHSLSMSEGECSAVYDELLQTGC